MIHLKRLPGFAYRYPICVALLFFLIAVYYLFNWRIFCTNWETLQQINNLCEKYDRGEVEGTLCKPLCKNKKIHSPTCQTFHANKEAVFSMIWGSSKLVFKSAKVTEEVGTVYWSDTHGVKHYPTDEEFESMVQDTVLTKYNLTVSSEQLRKLTHFESASSASDRRKIEMENIWTLIYDHEYLYTTLFSSEHSVFPFLIGSCGSFYSVEFLNPIEYPSHMFSLSESFTGWSFRIKVAIMILDLLNDLESHFPEPLHLCDVKLRHFGLSDNKQIVKFLDLDTVFTRSVINRMVADGSACTKHEDCDFFDCRSRCNLSSNKCDSPVINNNYQVVCEKIFLGYAISGAVIFPGLLMSQHTSSQLAAVLRLCADPEVNGLDVRVATPDSIRRHLYITLTEMDVAMSNQEFLR